MGLLAQRYQALFVAQGFDRIETGGFESREDTENYTDYDGYAEGEEQLLGFHDRRGKVLFNEESNEFCKQ